MSLNQRASIDRTWLRQHDQHLEAVRLELLHAIQLCTLTDNLPKEVWRGRRHLALDRLHRAVDQLNRALTPWLEKKD